MTFIRIMILLGVLGVPVSCAPTDKTGCAGWRPIRLDDQSVDYLAANDPKTLEGLIAHHEMGKSMRCWR